MKFGDLLNHLESRARISQLQVDSVELEMAMYFQLQKLVDTYDLDAFVVDNPIMAVTQSGEESYDLPDDFGRLVHPIESTGRVMHSGLRLFTSASVVNDLTYSRPQLFARLDRSTTGTPDTFTIMGRRLMLNPVPNSNDDDNYQVHGTYIMYVGMPDLDDQVLIDEPSFLVTSALYQIMADTPKVDPNVLQLLAREYTGQLSAIVNNQARVRQQLFNNQERIGRSYR